jgi:hypothetical protein
MDMPAIRIVDRPTSLLRANNVRLVDKQARRLADSGGDPGGRGDYAVVHALKRPIGRDAEGNSSNL